MENNSEQKQFTRPTPIDSAMYLTKRELISAMAMQGLLAQKNPQYNDRTILAESAIIYADELLNQLTK